MVFRRRGNLSIRPVHRIKHVIDSQTAATGGTQISIELIKSVDAPVLGNVTECETGSKVNGIYLKVEIINVEATQGALPNAYMGVVKLPANVIPTIPNMNVVGSSDLKKYVIHQEMVMLQKVTGSNPRTMFNGVIVIPRGYRRCGPDDKLTLFVFSPGIDLNVCIQCHYKEFR